MVGNSGRGDFPGTLTFSRGVSAPSSHLGEGPTPPGTVNPKILGGSKKVHFNYQIFEFMLRKEKNKIFFPARGACKNLFFCAQSASKFFAGDPKNCNF